VHTREYRSEQRYWAVGVREYATWVLQLTKKEVYSPSLHAFIMTTLGLAGDIRKY
ncbi:hypothetical protein DPMN_140643, partial [Dreissena polymorpha]